MKLMSKYFTLALLFLTLRTQAFSKQLCEQLFTNSHLSIGAKILHDKDNKLHISSPVEREVEKYRKKTGTKLTRPVDKINLWIEHLTKLANRASKSSNALSILKNYFYDQYLIKESEIPESYFEFQVRLAKERGHGDIFLTTEQKKQLAATLIIDQKKSLDSWIEYLVSKDTSMYTMWVKYWIFTGMIKLSKYNPSTGSYGNRDKGTVAPFAELNREALAIVIDLTLKKLNKESLTDIVDPEIVKLLEGLSFGKLYGRTLFNLGVGKEGNFRTNDGQWVIYKRGTDHKSLVESLEGKNTGWCTAGEATAKSQISKGDFHVYYSLDQFGKPSIPRVAI